MFLAIGYILWLFGKFYGYLVNFMVIWYILWLFGILLGKSSQDKLVVVEIVPLMISVLNKSQPKNALVTPPPKKKLQTRKQKSKNANYLYCVVSNIPIYNM
jgi:hypothetical protein